MSCRQGNYSPECSPCQVVICAYRFCRHLLQELIPGPEHLRVTDFGSATVVRAPSLQERLDELSKRERWSTSSISTDASESLGLFDIGTPSSTPTLGPKPIWSAPPRVMLSNGIESHALLPAHWTLDVSHVRDHDQDEGSCSTLASPRDTGLPCLLNSLRLSKRIPVSCDCSWHVEQEVEDITIGATLDLALQHRPARRAITFPPPISSTIEFTPHAEEVPPDEETASMSESLLGVADWQYGGEQLALVPVSEGSVQHTNLAYCGLWTCS